MQFALLISVIVALILSAFLLLTHVQSFFNIKSNELLEASTLSNQQILEPFQKIVVTKDTVRQEKEGRIKKLHATFHGAWMKVFSEITIHNRAISKTALVGSLGDNVSPNLYLVDTNSPLVVVGNTRIEGNSYVPKQGMKAGNISGNYYQGSSLYYGRVLESKKTLPPLSPDWISYLESLGRGILVDESNSIVASKDIKNSFYDHYQIIYDPATIILGDEKIAGNVIVQSGSRIIVENASQLQNVMLVAPEVTIKDNVKGSMQIVASKKISIGKNCYLSYPSSIVLYDQTKPANAAAGNLQNNVVDFVIGNNTKIEGGVVFLEKYPEQQNRIQTHLKMASGSEVIGEVYCQGNMDFQGIIRGSVYAKRFVANQSGSIYLNHIYNGKVLTNPIPNYAGLLFQDSENTVAQWLY
ncbi:hypothetical protein M0D21_13265 [Aquimarina sp. D1M17]|uniref:hypothetical protein n=1 Tax=Aquimarina acroporae TaxID=2937283 RepID=UPI0020C09816|nr:hypothetical protein [Aquimarina acroporae]MCK8522547.1 hypothetical protein [Aquimarina acroporae]